MKICYDVNRKLTVEYGDGSDWMERFKTLNRYQKCVLIIMAVMTLIFAVLYPITVAKVGVVYKGEVLVKKQEKGNILYSGKIKGTRACFTVSNGNTLVFQYGEKTYGPYTLTQDPTAIPESKPYGNMMGVELHLGGSLLFRGGLLNTGDFYLLYKTDGTLYDPIEITIIGSDGNPVYSNGIAKDGMEPSVQTVIELLHDPQLVRKGSVLVWFEATFFCALNAIWILYADELFRWSLSFWVRNANVTEPSDWEMARRYIGWTVLPILALVLFVIGLQ